MPLMHSIICLVHSIERKTYFDWKINGSYANFFTLHPILWLLSESQNVQMNKKKLFFQASIHGSSFGFDDNLRLFIFGWKEKKTFSQLFCNCVYNKIYTNYIHKSFSLQFTSQTNKASIMRLSLYAKESSLLKLQCIHIVCVRLCCV